MNCFNLSKSCWQKPTGLTLIVSLLLGISSEVYSFSLSRLIPQKARSFVAAHPRLVKTTAVGAALLGGYLLYQYLQRRNRRDIKIKHFMENVAGQFMSERHMEIADILGKNEKRKPGDEFQGMPNEVLGIINSYEVSSIKGRIATEIRLPNPAFWRAFCETITLGFYHPSETIGDVRAMVPLPGKRLALTSASYKNKIWTGSIWILDTDTGVCLKKFADLPGEIWGVAVAPDNKLVCITWDKKVTVFDLKTGAVVRSFDVDAGSNLTEFAVVPEGKLVLGVDGDVLSTRAFEVWNLDSGQREGTIECPDAVKKRGYRGYNVKSGYWSNRRFSIIPAIDKQQCSSLVVHLNNEIHIWNIPKRYLERRLTYEKRGSIWNMIYLRSGVIVAVTESGKLVKWNLGDPNIREPMSCLLASAIRPSRLVELQQQGHWLKALRESAEELPTQEIDSGHRVRTVDPRIDYIDTSLLALHDGTFASAAGTDIKIWDPATMSCLRTIDCKKELQGSYSISLDLLDDKRLIARVGRSKFLVVE